MDTLDDAIDYRKACVTRGDRIGSIFTRDGNVSQSGGMLMRNSGQPPPHMMKNVFGGKSSSTRFTISATARVLIYVCSCSSSALGTKRMMSTELEELSQKAGEVYEDHPRLDEALKQLRKANTDWEDRIDDIDRDTAQLEGTLAYILGTVERQLDIVRTAPMHVSLRTEVERCWGNAECPCYHASNCFALVLIGGSLVFVRVVFLSDEIKELQRSRKRGHGSSGSNRPAQKSRVQ